LLFPAKLPVILLTGTEGIAVGMSTKILPHNPVEVIKAEIACLQGKKFEVFPDFLTGARWICRNTGTGTERYG
jgi:topoisomerase-4 subunit A